MNDYIGKICPYCKTPLRPGDDIVVCSQCDMPHHKDCWIENQGCTTFGCLGTIKAPESGSTSVTATQLQYEDARPVFCTRCGTQNSSAGAFCSHCGNRLTVLTPPAPQAPVYTQANPLNADPYSYVNGQTSYQSTPISPELQQLVGTNGEYYLPKFQRMKTQNTNTSWNWVAFLVAPYWMMYRKMYGYAIAVLAADILISLIGVPFLSLLALGGYIALGVLGNYIYMKHLESKADQARAMNEPFKSQFLATNGGVNNLATVLAFLGRAILVGLLM